MAAFREIGGTTFLDRVWSESETAAQELGEDLQDNVFTALRVLGRGFVESNDGLDIDPDDEAALDELKEQSLVLLYRLMFVLYAESRRPDPPGGDERRRSTRRTSASTSAPLDIHEDTGRGRRRLRRRSSARTRLDVVAARRTCSGSSTRARRRSGFRRTTAGCSTR
ncbi:MAG: hypothetical protein U5K28_01640 [Halobacteriales archaeon]|nr:hypothetical protein [Halobacteriales archaeon]